MKHKGFRRLKRLSDGWKPIPFWVPPNFSGISIEKILKAKKMMDEAMVPEDDRYIFIAIRNHKKKRMRKKLNPIFF